jgi:hypothetical protein
MRQYLFVALIVVTQGPKILVNRLLWALFGEEYSSGCPLCDGKGHKVMQTLYPPDYTRSTWADEKCSSCNGFHD